VFRVVISDSNTSESHLGLEPARARMSMTYVALFFGSRKVVVAGKEFGGKSGECLRRGFISLS
jgi:hypothetical protein